MKSKHQIPEQTFETLATIRKIDPRANWYFSVMIEPRSQLPFPHHPGWSLFVENWGPGVIIVDSAAVAAGEYIRILDSAGLSFFLTQSLKASVEITLVRRTARILPPRKVVTLPA